MKEGDTKTFTLTLISQLCTGAADTTTLFVIALVAKGYAITRRKLSAATWKKISVFIAIYSCTQISLFIWAKVSEHARMANGNAYAFLLTQHHTALTLPPLLWNQTKKTVWILRGRCRVLPASAAWHRARSPAHRRRAVGYLRHRNFVEEEAKETIFHRLRSVCSFLDSSLSYVLCSVLARPRLHAGIADARLRARYSILRTNDAALACFPSLA